MVWKSTDPKPTVTTAPLDEEVHEAIRDALDGKYKDRQTYAEDVQDAFNKIPREQIENAAAILRDLGNEAVKNMRYDEAAEHYTSVLAAWPQDHEILANRSLAYLNIKGREEEALNDAALCVNLKPNWAKGFYRFGCALDKCKKWKEAAAVFAKVVEMEPDNVEAGGKLINAREMIKMVMNVERVQDPLWMHKPEPPKTELEDKLESATVINEQAMGAVREEIGRIRFDFELLTRHMDVSDKWYADSVLAKGLNAHLVAHSAVLAPRQQLGFLLDPGSTGIYCESIRRVVPQLLPRGLAGVVYHLGSCFGLLPLISMEAGANKVYVVEPHAFLAKMAHAHVQRHTLICFERENWARLPMSISLSERVKGAGAIAFKAGLYEKAIALYTEALPPTDRVPELKANLLCNRALCYLKLEEAEAALADARAALGAVPESTKAFYRKAQALQKLGRFSDAREALAAVLRHSKGGKNADASKLLAELEGLKDSAAPPPMPPTAGAGAAAARRAMIREDRAQRLTMTEVNEQLASRCERFGVHHTGYDKMRMHHEVHAKADCVVLHNFDFTLLGRGVVRSINALKQEELLRAETTVIPSAARLWALAVQVSTDVGVPINMSAMEDIFWAPCAREVHMDKPWAKKHVRPMTKPAVAWSLDFRPTAPRVKRNERAPLRLTVTATGVVHAVVYWYELNMGAGAVLTTAPRVAVAEGATKMHLGQAMQFVPARPVAAGELLELDVQHNRTAFRFSHLGARVEEPRRGLCLPYDIELATDGHNNRTMAAATRKAMFSFPKSKGLLVLNVGCSFGTLAIVAAQARPEAADFVVATDKSAVALRVAEKAAAENQVSERVSWLQKDARNLTAHEDMPHKADVMLIGSFDHTLLGEGVIHYVSSLRGTFTQEMARIIPAAAVLKGMLVQLRTGEIHGVDMTMSDAYRWSKEIMSVEIEEHSYTQLTEVFDIFVFDFSSAVLEQQVENMDIVISKDGIVSALVIWYDLILDEDIVSTTSPFAPPEQRLGHGQGLVYLQPAECKVVRGTTLPVVAAHNGLELAFTIDEDKMTRRSEVELLPHTRYDPRWEGARANLDDQWKKIMMNLAHNPKELKLLQEAVMRFAAQPTTFGIEPSVAERCALTFLAE